MFVISQDYRISVSASIPTPEQRPKFVFETWKELDDIIRDLPGVRAVALWNNLPGVTPILTPKFRNRSTAVERIWNKLRDLYPNSIPQTVSVDPTPETAITEDVPKSKTAVKQAAKPVAKSPKKRGVSWAAELEAELRKKFNPGDTFELSDVYKLVPIFQRRRPDNHHVAARLRTTLAQDLRGKGAVKTTGKGKYRIMAA